MNKRNNMFDFFTIMLVSSGISFVISSLLGNQLPSVQPDSQMYLSEAQNILRGIGFKNTFTDQILSPGYPLFLAMMQFVFKSLACVSAAQFLMFGLICSFMASILKSMNIKRTWIYLTIALMCINPVIIINNPTRILTEYLYSLSLILIVLYIFKIENTQSTSPSKPLNNAILLSILFAVNVLIRPHLLLIFPFLVVYLFLIGRKWSIPKKFIVVATCIPIALLLINSSINLHYSNTFTPSVNYAGIVLYYGNNANTKAEYWNDEDDSDKLAHFTDGLVQKSRHLPMSEQDKIYKKAAIQYILKHPMKTTVFTLKKAGLMMARWNYANDNNRLHLILFWMDFGALILAIIGLSISILSKTPFMKFSIIILVFLAFYVLSTSLGNIDLGNRYRFPILPIYFLYIPVLLNKLLNSK